MKIGDFLKVGEFSTFSKTISESDVYLFTGIIGNFSPIHVNEEYMKKTRAGKRIVNAILVFSFASTASAILQEKVVNSLPSLSAGYERVRFIKPVFFGDTITVRYEVAEIDEENMKAFCKITITKQTDEICAAGTHILKFYHFEE